VTSTHTPAREIGRALINLYRGDPQFSASGPSVGGTGGLLFPDWSPRVHANDYRVWTNHVQLPPDMPEVLTALPRILFDVRWRSHPYEQEEEGLLHGPVTATLIVQTPKEREDYADELMAAAYLRLLSTPLSSARIIAAELAPTTGDIMKVRLSAFDDAFQMSADFRSQNVGVLV
jgi:hypothetical protein